MLYMSEMDSSSSTIWEYSYRDEEKTNTGRKKYDTKINLSVPVRKKSSLVISFPTRKTLRSLGRHNDSYDKIVKRLVEYDIMLHGT